MVMSLEKYVLLRAKVPKMNSKPLEVDGAEEHRLLRGGVQASPRLVFNFHVLNCISILQYLLQYRICSMA